MTESITYNGRQFRDVNAGRASPRIAPPVPPKKRSKYGNRYCIIGNERFDSEKEGRRHLVLLDMQRKGEIRNLKRQVWFKLVVNGELIGKVRPDWTYQRRTCLNGMTWVFADPPAYGSIVAEDCKGFQTRDHKTRWKLAKALHPEIEWRLS